MMIQIFLFRKENCICDEMLYRFMAEMNNLVWYCHKNIKNEIIAQAILGIFSILIGMEVILNDIKQEASQQQGHLIKLLYVLFSLFGVQILWTAAIHFVLNAKLNLFHFVLCKVSQIHIKSEHGNHYFDLVRFGSQLIEWFFNSAQQIFHEIDFKSDKMDLDILEENFNYSLHAQHLEMLRCLTKISLIIFEGHFKA